MNNLTRSTKPGDVPFSTAMDDDAVARLASIDAFARLSEKFRTSPQFARILKLHGRRLNCQDGDIIVRKGDWGNSAFFIINGSVVVEIEPADAGLPQEVLGRRRGKKKNLWQVISQLWSNHKTAEYRDKSSYYSTDPRTSTRGQGQETRVYVQDVPEVMQRYKHVTMNSGQFFGEIGALGRTARTATVLARGEVELLELRWQGLRDLIRRDDGMRQQIIEHFRERSLKTFLASSSVFTHLQDDEDAMEALVQAAQVETYGEYDRAASFKKLAEEGAADMSAEPLIAREGDYPNGIVMIRNGLSRISHIHHHGHRTVSYLLPGQMFGFPEIVDGFRTNKPVPLRCSLRAIGFLMAVIIPTPLVEEYVLKHPLSPWREEASHAQRNLLTQALPFDAENIGQGIIEFLVQERFVNGTATMLIDLDRCTRCDDCVRACAATHDNNPRFVRDGPVHKNVMVAGACLHCQDPVCMIECPTGAISRRWDVGAIAINDDTCVGCGTCASNCPYDAIRMVEIRDENGEFIRDMTTAAKAPITKATKCDLCVDQLGGPACARACPHDALARVNMSDLRSFSQWYER